jgi:iron complex transport system substrate-binding protein
MLTLKKIAALLLVLLLVFSLAACAGTNDTDTEDSEAGASEVLPQNTADAENEASADGSSVTITDMAGRTVTVNGPIERIIANQPETMELVLAVAGESAADKIVAVGSNKSAETVMGMYAEKFPQLADLPGINDGTGFDTEAIIALEPDVFVLNTWFLDSLTETIETLDRAGIVTVVLDMSSDAMEAPQTAIGIIGELFGEQERAQELINFINEQLDLVRDANLAERTDKPTVYIEKGSGTAEAYDVSFSSGQWASVVEVAGGDNVAVGAIDGDTQIDPEYLISSNPDFIFIAGLGFGTKSSDADAVFEAYTSRTGWDTLTAVADGNVYQVAHLMSRNPTCFYPTLVMAKLFYPDVFADVDPEAILQEYFDRFMYLDYDQGIWFAQISE